MNKIIAVFAFLILSYTAKAQLDFDQTVAYLKENLIKYKFYSFDRASGETTPCWECTVSNITATKAGIVTLTTLDGYDEPKKHTYTINLFSIAMWSSDKKEGIHYQTYPSDNSGVIFFGHTNEALKLTSKVAQVDHLNRKRIYTLAFPKQAGKGSV